MSWEKHHSHSWTWNSIFSQESSNIARKASIYYILVSQPPKQREIKLFWSVLHTQTAALQCKSPYLVTGFPILTVTRNIHSQQSFQWIFMMQTSESTQCFLQILRVREIMEFSQWHEKHCLQWKEWLYFILTLAGAYRLVSEKYQY